MRVSFYTAVLLPLIIGQQEHVVTSVSASSLDTEVLAYIEAEADPQPKLLTQSESESEADIDNEKKALIDLDCLNDLLNDCDAGSESACEEILGNPAPCSKKSVTSQPSFKAPVKKP